MSETSPVPPLSQGVGYGVVIGLGVAFAIGEEGTQLQGCTDSPRYGTHYKGIEESIWRRQPYH